MGNFMDTSPFLKSLWLAMETTHFPIAAKGLFFKENFVLHIEGLVKKWAPMKMVLG